MPLGVERIGQVALNVREIERATAFYRDVLGVRHLFSASPRSASPRSALMCEVR